MRKREREVRKETQVRRKKLGRRMSRVHKRVGRGKEPRAKCKRKKEMGSSKW